MIIEMQTKCPKCGGELKIYGSVLRIIRTKKRISKWIKLRRFKCVLCGSVHRELPNYLLPYKQYEAEIIIGVVEGIITSDTLGYEDYPCEMNMKRWLKKDI